MLGGRCLLPDDRRSKRTVSIDATPNRCRCNVHCTVRPDTVSRVLLETSHSSVAGPHGVCRCPPGSARGSAGVPAGGRLTRLFDPCHRRGAQAPPPRVQGLVPSSDLPQTAEATGGGASARGVGVRECGLGNSPDNPPLTLPRHLRCCGREQRFRVSLPGDDGASRCGCSPAARGSPPPTEPTGLAQHPLPPDALPPWRSGSRTCSRASGGTCAPRRRTGRRPRRGARILTRCSRRAVRSPRGRRRRRRHWSRGTVRGHRRVD